MPSSTILLGFLLLLINKGLAQIENGTNLPQLIALISSDTADCKPTALGGLSSCPSYGGTRITMLGLNFPLEGATCSVCDALVHVSSNKMICSLKPRHGAGLWTADLVPAYVVTPLGVAKGTLYVQYRSPDFPFITNITVSALPGAPQPLSRLSCVYDVPMALLSNCPAGGQVRLTLYGRHLGFDDPKTPLLPLPAVPVDVSSSPLYSRHSFLSSLPSICVPGTLRQEVPQARVSCVLAPCPNSTSNSGNDDPMRSTSTTKTVSFVLIARSPTHNKDSAVHDFRSNIISVQYNVEANISTSPAFSTPVPSQVPLPPSSPPPPTPSPPSTPSPSLTPTPAPILLSISVGGLPACGRATDTEVHECPATGHVILTFRGLHFGEWGAQVPALCVPFTVLHTSSSLLTCRLQSWAPPSASFSFPLSFSDSLSLVIRNVQVTRRLPPPADPIAPPLTSNSLSFSYASPDPTTTTTTIASITAIPSVVMPHITSITASRGCFSSGRLLFNCPTNGRAVLTINGYGFTATSSSSSSSSSSSASPSSSSSSFSSSSSTASSLNSTPDAQIFAVWDKTFVPFPLCSSTDPILTSDTKIVCSLSVNQKAQDDADVAGGEAGKFGSSFISQFGVVTVYNSRTKQHSNPVLLSFTNSNHSPVGPISMNLNPTGANLYPNGYTLDLYPRDDVISDPSPTANVGPQLKPLVLSIAATGGCEESTIPGEAGRVLVNCPVNMVDGGGVVLIINGVHFGAAGASVPGVCVPGTVRHTLLNGDRQVKCALILDETRIGQSFDLVFVTAMALFSVDTPPSASGVVFPPFAVRYAKLSNNVRFNFLSSPAIDDLARRTEEERLRPNLSGLPVLFGCGRIANGLANCHPAGGEVIYFHGELLGGFTSNVCQLLGGQNQNSTDNISGGAGVGGGRIIGSTDGKFGFCVLVAAYPGATIFVRLRHEEKGTFQPMVVTYATNIDETIARLSNPLPLPLPVAAVAPPAASFTSFSSVASTPILLPPLSPPTTTTTSTTTASSGAHFCTHRDFYGYNEGEENTGGEGAGIVHMGMLSLPGFWVTKTFTPAMLFPTTTSTSQAGGGRDRVPEYSFATCPFTSRSFDCGTFDNNSGGDGQQRGSTRTQLINNRVYEPQQCRLRELTASDIYRCAPKTRIIMGGDSLTRTFFGNLACRFTGATPAADYLAEFRPLGEDPGAGHKAETESLWSKISCADWYMGRCYWGRAAGYFPQAISISMEYFLTIKLTAWKDVLYYYAPFAAEDVIVLGIGAFYEQDEAQFQSDLSDFLLYMDHISFPGRVFLFEQPARHFGSNDEGVFDINFPEAGCAIPPRSSGRPPLTQVALNLLERCKTGIKLPGGSFPPDNRVADHQRCTRVHFLPTFDSSHPQVDAHWWGSKSETNNAYHFSDCLHYCIDSALVTHWSNLLLNFICPSPVAAAAS